MKATLDNFEQWALPSSLRYHYAIFDEGYQADTIDPRKTISSIREINQEDQPLAFAMHNGKCTKEHRIPYLFGQKGNRLIFRDLLNGHILCAGQTGGGKTNYARCLLASLMHFNHPEFLKIFVFDPKKGLSQFKYLYHFYTEYDEIRNGLQKLADILAYRKTICGDYDQFGDVIDINAVAYQKRQKKQIIPFIFVLFDEFANTSCKAAAKKHKDLTTNLSMLAAESRSLGMRIMLMSQAIYRDHLDSFIKGNMCERICFRLTDKPQERNLFDPKGPCLTPSLPTGHFIAQEKGEKVRYKSLRCSDKCFRHMSKNLERKKFLFRFNAKDRETQGISQIAIERAIAKKIKAQKKAKKNAPIKSEEEIRAAAAQEFAPKNIWT